MKRRLRILSEYTWEDSDLEIELTTIDSTYLNVSELDALNVGICDNIIYLFRSKKCWKLDDVIESYDNPLNIFNKLIDKEVLLSIKRDLTINKLIAW